jgi:DnaJ-domain-containing protein 1
MTGILPLVFVGLMLAVIGLSLYRVLPQGTLEIARIGAGVAMLLVALWALLARQVAIALGLFGIALALLRPLAAAWSAAPSPGQRSEVRTDALAMTLDHDTGEMEGEVLAGRFAGRALSGLTTEELQALLDELEEDEDSVSLLLAYLDRLGGGRGDGADGGAEAGDAGRAPPEPGAMSEAEAYRVLGLAPGASIEEIRTAHRRLMKRVHPDLGGSPALAALLNAAKSRLDPGRS